MILRHIGNKTACNLSTNCECEDKTRPHVTLFLSIHKTGSWANERELKKPRSRSISNLGGLICDFDGISHSSHFQEHFSFSFSNAETYLNIVEHFRSYQKHTKKFRFYTCAALWTAQILMPKNWHFLNFLLIIITTVWPQEINRTLNNNLDVRRSTRVPICANFTASY